jgi:hypothetical protein
MLKRVVWVLKMADDLANGESVVLNNTGISTVNLGDECLCCVSLKRELKCDILDLELATEIIRLLREVIFSDVIEVMSSLKGGLNKKSESKSKSDSAQGDGKNQIQELGSWQSETTEEWKVTFEDNKGLYSRAEKGN